MDVGWAFKSRFGFAAAIRDLIPSEVGRVGFNTADHPLQSELHQAPFHVRVCVCARVYVRERVRACECACICAHAAWACVCAHINIGTIESNGELKARTERDVTLWRGGNTPIMTSSALPAGLPAVHELQFCTSCGPQIQNSGPGASAHGCRRAGRHRNRRTHSRERNRGRRRTLPSASKAFGSNTAGSSLLRLPV